MCVTSTGSIGVRELCGRGAKNPVWFNLRIIFYSATGLSNSIRYAPAWYRIRANISDPAMAPMGWAGHRAYSRPAYSIWRWDPKQGRERYRALFRHALDAPALDKIRGALNSGLALGNDLFKAQIEEQFARRVTQAPLGRPRIALP